MTGQASMLAFRMRLTIIICVDLEGYRGNVAIVSSQDPSETKGIIRHQT